MGEPTLFIEGSFRAWLAFWRQATAGMLTLRRVCQGGGNERNKERTAARSGDTVLPQLRKRRRAVNMMNDGQQAVWLDKVKYRRQGEVMCKQAGLISPTGRALESLLACLCWLLRNALGEECALHQNDCQDHR
eukprot:1157848-Pelagomonas_calceolata.AAC.4